MVQPAQWRPFVLIVLLCCVAAMVRAAENRKPAEVMITPGQVCWKTIAEAQGCMLTVTGQGIYLCERYEDGETPSLRPTAPHGECLPDGIYRWKLRAINPEWQESPATSRAPARTRRMRTERGNFEPQAVWSNAWW